MSVLDSYVGQKIVPVAVVENESELRSLADLCAEYIPAIELTMRTNYALDALKILKKDYPTVTSAAATILNVSQAKQALETGVDLLISPGYTPDLVEYCFENNIQYVPGVSTPADLEYCLSKGFKLLKFFPAEVLGGIKWLQAIAPVYGHTGVSFMPLGGVNLENVKSYLDLDIVSVCGGSWICPRALIQKKEWKEIESRFIEVKKIIEEYK